MHSRNDPPGTDFRGRLYERYVSTFKGRQPAAVQPDPERYWSWCRYRILPLLEGADRSAPVLELGCGPGDMLAFLGRQGFEDVLGIDISEEQVRIASARGLTARKEDVFAFLSANEKTYGAIVALDFVEHFSKDELLDILPLVRDALKPGGLLVLQTPNGQGLLPGQVIYGDLTHMTIFNPGSLAQVLTLVGFRDIACSETGPVPHSIKGAVRVALWRAIRVVANLVRLIETGKPQRVWTENLLCRCRRD